MEKYKKKLYKRITWMSFITILIAVTYIILQLNSDKLPAQPDFVKGFQMGGLCGVELVLVFFILKYITSMRDEKALKILQIEECDERTIMIMQKTGAAGFNICIMSLAFATVIAGFVNQTVFFSLLGATLFTALVKFFFIIYYHKKL